MRGLGYRHSEESKQKISAAKMGHPVSEEARKKLSIFFKGKFLGDKHPMWGKHHSEESKKKMSINRIGKCIGPDNPNYRKIFSKETRLKMSIASKGRIISEEQRRKTSETQKRNRKNDDNLRRLSSLRRGIPLSKETKAKLSAGRMGENNPGWNGGRTIDRHGYVKILSKGHPFADRDGYVAEHRLIAERALGRCLNRKEVVHHVNGIQGDNRPRNLIICEDFAYHQLIHRRERAINKSH